jgi:hypothetical protein
MTNTIIEIIIDNSGSMGYMKGSPEHENKYLIDGLTRMTLLKQVIIDHVIPTIEYADRVFIRTFRFNSKKVSGKDVDELSIPIIYQGAFDHSKILSAINSLQDPPIGGTPITAAINAAVANLAMHKNSDRKIILLTDGEENGGGDFREAAKKAEQLQGIPCKIFIIGLDQDEQSEIKSRAIASGGYYNIKSKSFTTNEVHRVLAPLKVAVLQDTIQNVLPITNTVQYKPQYQRQESKVETIEKKLSKIKQDGQQGTALQLDELESKIKEQLLNTQKLLSELSSLKEMYRIDALLETGIDATTLTVDNEYSESVRHRSEKFLYKVLCDKHGKNKVKWLNEAGESYSHHDFELLNENANLKTVIECKGTSKTKPTFYLTSGEWNHFLAHKEFYQLFRVFNVDGEMYEVCLDNLLTSILSGQVVPYLLKPEILKEGRVFLTLIEG